VTYVSVLAGLMAVMAASDLGSWSMAGALIALCALADTLDGRFARLFPRTEDEKRFGVQLDSLADALTFGLVPVVCLYLLLPLESVPTRLGWCAAALAYVLSTITRLGVYNLQSEEPRGFVGLPTTAAGLIWSSAFLTRPSTVGSATLLVVCGAAMVSGIPIPRPRGLGLVAFGGWSTVLLILHGLSASAGG